MMRTPEELRADVLSFDPNGKNLKIDEILIQTRDTVRFEVQHRAWVNGGIGLSFGRTSEEQSATPRIIVTNNTGRPPDSIGKFLEHRSNRTAPRSVEFLQQLFGRSNTA